MNEKTYVEISVVNVALIYTVLMLTLPMGEKLSTLYGKSVYISALSLLSSLFLTPFMIYLSRRLELFDQPGERKIHQIPTPRLGGTAIFLSIILTSFAGSILTEELKGIITASLVVFIIGLLDDLLQIRADIRLLAQIAAVAILYHHGVKIKLFNEDSIYGIAGNVLLSLFWIIGITNAVNFLDGIDGLAASLSIVMSGFIFIIAFQNDQLYIGLLAIAVIGSTAGFLPYNFKVKGHADIFLGDSGSTFLGFLLASMAIGIDWTSGIPLLSITAPVLIFWIPIYDMVHTTITRIITGKVKTIKQWIEYTGTDHLHHRMAALFGGQKVSVIVITLLTIAFGSSVLLLRRATFKDQVVIFLQNLLFIMIITLLEYCGNRALKRLKENNK